ncbi:hypothetical protein [Streptomyces sp. GQFP]|uniref:hypothetical protein n=1 Tax=Streptomyces sp. GQFP TaxID=2907545 RepID=UPI002E1C4C64
MSASHSQYTPARCTSAQYAFVRGAGWPVESFTMYDDAQVNVELVSAHLTVTQPGEIAEYARAFAELSANAVYGTEARSLITGAIDALG